jgi:hypothetical protein
MTEASSAFTNFILAQLRVASARAKLVGVEADSIITALSGDFINADAAIAWAHDVGVDLIAPSSVIPSTSAA